MGAFLLLTSPELLAQKCFSQAPSLQGGQDPYQAIASTRLSKEGGEVVEKLFKRIKSRWAGAASPKKKFVATTSNANAALSATSQRRIRGTILGRICKIRCRQGDDSGNELTEIAVFERVHGDVSTMTVGNDEVLGIGEFLDEAPARSIQLSVFESDNVKTMSTCPGKDCNHGFDRCFGWVHFCC